MSFILKNRKEGLPDTIETYGLISGLWTSTFALGAFIGPSASGYLYDSIGFRKSTIFVIGMCILFQFEKKKPPTRIKLILTRPAGLHVAVAMIVVLFMLLERTPKPYKELSSTESLLKRSRESLVYSQTNLDKK